jgi:hypothetical protein
MTHKRRCRRSENNVGHVSASLGKEPGHEGAVFALGRLAWACAIFRHRICVSSSNMFICSFASQASLTSAYSALPMNFLFV